MSVQMNRLQRALNGSVNGIGFETSTADDASWILTNAFLILTMQSGFGLLEAGYVSSKNVANIMVKNIVDVTLGGVSYWMFGYALSFGKPSTPFCGTSGFFFDATHQSENGGSAFVHYVFHFSFATTATTIVSGAIAERVRLHAYNLFSFFNTLVYCFPASWAWNDTGWLQGLGFFDFAGSCVVHVSGGASAFVATFMMGPRLGWCKEDPRTRAMSSPVTALTGAFMLWWAWLGFNCGSSFGVSGGLWRTSSAVAVNTLNASIGGALTGISLSLIIKKGKYDIRYLLNSILSGLVSITGVAAVTTARESILIGAIGSVLALGTNALLVQMGVDDPVGSIPVHFVGGTWSTLAVGLFSQTTYSPFFKLQNGLFHGGGFKQLGLQMLGLITIVLWSSCSTFFLLLALRHTVGLRLTPAEEILGADWVEHNVRSDYDADKTENGLVILHRNSTVGTDMSCSAYGQMRDSNYNLNPSHTRRQSRRLSQAHLFNQHHANSTRIDMSDISETDETTQCIPSETHTVGLSHPVHQVHTEVGSRAPTNYTLSLNVPALATLAQKEDDFLEDDDVDDYNEFDGQSKSNHVETDRTTVSENS